jgi:hypothetical protein
MNPNGELFSPPGTPMSVPPNGHQRDLQSRGAGQNHPVWVIHHHDGRCSGLNSSQSGRRLVVVAGIIILGLWGVMYLKFRGWREQYRIRASFGASEVAPLVDSFVAICPSDVNKQAWREAVERTHEMLVTITGANLLSLEQMKVLREELKQTIERARDHPDTAVDELAGIWNDMADRARFVLEGGSSGRYKGHPRPSLLPPRKTRPRVPSVGSHASKGS